MAVRIMSSGTLGVDGYRVEVEVDVSKGAFGYETVGLPDAAIRESRQRVKAAIVNARLDFPKERIVVNLSPADIRKEGTAYDLPIAIGILAASGQLALAEWAHSLFIGELSLSGELRPVRGLLTMLLSARDAGIQRAVVPIANGAEAGSVDGLEVVAARTLAEVVGIVLGKVAPTLAEPANRTADVMPIEVDMRFVRGQASARRAVEVAAAGGHALLLSGPPGTGKTLLSRALHGILPPLEPTEQIEVSRVHSVAGLLGGGLATRRPFRAPHHTASAAAIIGGGSGIIRPGEVSLAHRGVLFLDELPEFPRSVREVLRQPMESGEVHLARASAAIRLPAAFQLVATMNPCPCGYHGWPSAGRECRCTPAAVQRYAERVSGPLLDRFDLRVECPPVEYKDLLQTPSAEDSSSIRARVWTARRRQSDRYRGSRIRCNADLQGPDIDRLCRLDDSTSRLARLFLEKGRTSARGYHRALRVARTLADLGGLDEVTAEHFSEAVQFRL